MGLFGFLSWSLVTIIAVTILWPLNVPALALAYKIRCGQQPVQLDKKEFWLRSTFAALGLALLTVLLLAANGLLVRKAELPVGPVQLVLLLVYLPTAIWFVFWMYALEDMLQSLSVFFLYVLLAGLPLLLLGRLFRVWTALGASAPWLWAPIERV